MNDWCTPEVAAKFFIEVMRLQREGMLPKPLNSRSLTWTERETLNVMAKTIRRQIEFQTIKDVQEE